MKYETKYCIGINVKIKTQRRDNLHVKVAQRYRLENRNQEKTNNKTNNKISHRGYGEDVVRKSQGSENLGQSGV